LREEEDKTTLEDNDNCISSRVGLALGFGVGITSTTAEDDDIWALDCADSLGDGVGVTSGPTSDEELAEEDSTSTKDDWLGVASTTIDEDAMIALDDNAEHNAPSNVPAGATTTSSRATMSPENSSVSIRTLKVVIPVAVQ
jgi:hypothetical protein